MAYILAVVLVTMFAALAVAFASDTDMNVRLAENQVHGQNAQFNAESGLAYLANVFKKLSGLGRNDTPVAVMDKMAAQLPGLLGNSLAGQTIQHPAGGATLDVPYVSFGAGGGFTAHLDVYNGKLRVQVTGKDTANRYDGTPLPTVRQARMSFAVGSNAAHFKYGLQTNSSVSITGNARLIGADGNAVNASVYSATANQTAVTMNGNCRIDGDVYITNPQGSASLTGNISIGGATLSGGHIYEHIAIGCPQTDFPDADPSPFEPYATNIVDGSTSTNGNKTFTNIRIRANTNPTFSGNITINGIMFIETPNRVTFAGNLNYTGVVITQVAAPGNLAANTLKFTGNSSFRGVEYLPDQPQFAGLKAMPGTFLLAKGFSVTFNGNFGTMNGSIGADEFKWTGNAGGDVYGGIINWSDSAFAMVGNSSLTIHKPDDNATAPGFVGSPKLLPLQGSYEEPQPGQ